MSMWVEFWQGKDYKEAQGILETQYPLVCPLTLGSQRLLLSSAWLIAACCLFGAGCELSHQIS